MIKRFKVKGGGVWLERDVKHNEDLFKVSFRDGKLKLYSLGPTSSGAGAELPDFTELKLELVGGDHDS